MNIHRPFCFRLIYDLTHNLIWDNCSLVGLVTSWGEITSLNTSIQISSNRSDAALSGRLTHLFIRPYYVDSAKRSWKRHRQTFQEFHASYIFFFLSRFLFSSRQFLRVGQVVDGDGKKYVEQSVCCQNESSSHRHEWCNRNSCNSSNNN